MMPRGGMLPVVACAAQRGPGDPGLPDPGPDLAGREGGPAAVVN